MTELTDFSKEEQKLINEMFSLDYTSQDFEKRKWEILGPLSTEGLVYVQEHIFDIVYKKLETDTNKAISALEKIEREQTEKHELAIQQCKKEGRQECTCLLIFALVSVLVFTVIYIETV